MELIAQTIAGIEDIAIQEIQELISVKAKIKSPGRIQFEASEEQIQELIYMTRSITKIYEFKQEIIFESIPHLIEQIQDFPFEDTFVVRCQRWGEHTFNSLEAEQEIGEYFYDKGHKVDLKKPNTTILADITENKCLLGIDLTPKELLSKRDYRIKAHPKSINASLAYAIIRHSGWTKDKVLLDPNCKDGVIPIEAALWASKVPRGYFERGEHIEKLDKQIDKHPLKITAADPLLTNIRSSEINSKLAEIKKQLKFTKLDFDWLDIKFSEGEVDYIITNLTESSTHLFETAETILAPKGKLLILTHKPEKTKTNKLKLIETKEIGTKNKYFLLTFER